jgi:hypothetical protein
MTCEHILLYGWQKRSSRGIHGALSPKTTRYRQLTYKFQKIIFYTDVVGGLLAVADGTRVFDESTMETEDDEMRGLLRTPAK